MLYQDDQIQHRRVEGGTAGFVIAVTLCLLIGVAWFGSLTFQRIQHELQVQMEKEREATHAKLKALSENAQMESGTNSRPPSAGGDESVALEISEEVSEPDATDVKT